MTQKNPWPKIEFSEFTVNHDATIIWTDEKPLNDGEAFLKPTLKIKIQFKLRSKTLIRLWFMIPSTGILDLSDSCEKS